MLAIWIVGSNLPISAVEDPNMEKYVKILNPEVLTNNLLFIFYPPPAQASLPSRSTLRKVLSVYEKMNLLSTSVIPLLSTSVVKVADLSFHIDC